MHIDYVEEEDKPVPGFEPPTPTHREALALLRKRNATLQEVAAALGISASLACSTLGELKRGGWVGVQRLKQEGSALLRSEFFARRPREVNGSVSGNAVVLEFVG